MTVSVTPSVEWVSQCYNHGETHEHVSLYLVRDGDDVILVDSGSFYHREAITSAVDDATDGCGPDAIILSHSDYPHAGNVSPLGGDTEDVELVASSGSPEQQGLPDARKCKIGGRLDVTGRTFSFIDPPLADRSHTTWIFDHGDGVLFTADGFGNYHEPGQCRNRSSEFDGMISTEQIYEYHRDNLVWLRYVAPEKVERTLDRIFAEFDVNAIAPVHGNPIDGDDIDVYRDRLYDAMRRIADEYEVD
ncbi:MBL fold metallo-hydrolase [Halobacteria archaeon AArc-m2/3/4]|uniref:MBL fold metallo-hydrolase n=1 Tax=Natronoglomus mannanivorans TaxID=2979990 RepID=A0AAP2Z2Q3_9EURY|nr:MBL fold metallo-hydrolase [Halobacteria archaeon AArc-xg1-1]MCU4974094.1 MBL fold metallo-hydrolase [Halobacteria archaeon AArc-m2/3/4]